MRENDISCRFILTKFSLFFESRSCGEQRAGKSPHQRTITACDPRRSFTDLWAAKLQNDSARCNAMRNGRGDVKKWSGVSDVYSRASLLVFVIFGSARTRPLPCHITAIRVRERGYISECAKQSGSKPRSALCRSRYTCVVELSTRVAFPLVGIHHSILPCLLPPRDIPGIPVIRVRLQR